MKKKELEELLERERGFNRSLHLELRELQRKVYGPISKDEIIKEEAVDFAKFLFTMNVYCVDYEKQLYKTKTGMAPDILTESLESMYRRHIESKVPFGAY